MLSLVKKKIYLLYGIDFIQTNTRDRFHVAIPVLDRTGLFFEKFTFHLTLRYNGSIELRYLNPSTTMYQCLYSVQNIGTFDPQFNQYVVDLGSRDGINFDSSPLTVTDNLLVSLGNFKGMQMMEPVTTSNLTSNCLNPLIKLPETTLFNVNGDTTDLVYRELCPNVTNVITPSNTTTTLANGTSAATAALNFGQGSVLKMYNLNACYVN